MRILAAIGTGLPANTSVGINRLISLITGDMTLLTVVKSEADADHAENVLTSAVQGVDQRTLKIKPVVRIGKLGQEIVDEVSTGGYDLLIIEDETYRILFGGFRLPFNRVSFSEIPCPILIARGDQDSVQRFLICESGRTPTLLARLLSRLPALITSASELTVLHVMSQIAAVPGVSGWELRADANELIQKHTPEGQLLENDLALMKNEHIDVKAIVRHGLVVQEILEEIQDGYYDLLIIGILEHQGWKRYLLDDQAHDIINKSTLSVLVIV